MAHVTGSLAAKSCTGSSFEAHVASKLFKAVAWPVHDPIGSDEAPNPVLINAGSHFTRPLNLVVVGVVVGVVVAVVVVVVVDMVVLDTVVDVCVTEVDVPLVVVLDSVVLLTLVVVLEIVVLVAVTVVLLTLVVVLDTVVDVCVTDVDVLLVVVLDTVVLLTLVVVVVTVVDVFVTVVLLTLVVVLDTEVDVCVTEVDVSLVVVLDTVVLLTLVVVLDTEVDVCVTEVSVALVVVLCVVEVAVVAVVEVPVTEVVDVVDVVLQLPTWKKWTNGAAVTTVSLFVRADEYSRHSPVWLAYENALHCTLKVWSGPEPPEPSKSSSTFSKKPSHTAPQTSSDAMALTLSSSTLSLPRTPSIGPVYLPKQEILVVVVVVVVVAVVAVVVVGLVLHTLVAESSAHAPSARHSFGDSLKHGSGFSIVVVVVVDVVTAGAAEHPEPVSSEVASNKHPSARHFFLRSPAHLSKGEHCFTPSTVPKTQSSVFLHFFRFSPSHTLPLPSALLHILDALSKTHPSVDLHTLPFRPLHTFF